MAERGDGMIFRSKGVLGRIVCVVEAVSVWLDIYGVDVRIVISGIVYKCGVCVQPSGEFSDFSVVVSCLREVS